MRKKERTKWKSLYRQTLILILKVFEDIVGIIGKVKDNKSSAKI